MKFGRILAMTFTNKAANEMKERILQKLIQLAKAPAERSIEDEAEIITFAKELGIKEDTLCDQAKKSLNAILHHYGMFSVMTIDKFTHKVIRTFAKELGLSLDFDVELDLESLRNNVADLLFDKIGRDKEVTELMQDYAESNLADDKSWNFKNSLIEFSKQLFKEEAIEAIKLLEKHSAKEFLAAKKQIIKESEAFKASIRKLGQEALDLIASKQLTQDDFVKKSNSMVAAFKLMADLNKVAPFTDAKKELAQAESWGHKDSPNKTTVQAIQPLLYKYFEQIEEKFEADYPRFLLNSELLKLVNNLSLMNHLLSVTEELKVQDNVLLISDFYKKIAEIIAKEPVPFIYERLGVRYDHFLLDEFQDTSHLQWVNLVPLLHNSLAMGHLNLIVGDGKQAIYRWRNGEVDQFIQLPESIYNPGEIISLNEAEITFKNEGLRIDLESNYRSAPEIVEFNNSFFAYLKRAKEAYIQAIYESAKQVSKKSHSGYLAFKFEEEKDNSWQHAYALNVIKESLQKGYQLKDICILVRKNSDGSEIATFLKNAGIRVVSQDSLFVSKDKQVRFIFNLICSIASPYNENYAKKCIEHYDALFCDHPHIFNVLDKKVDIIAWMKTEGIELKTHEHFHSFYEFVEHLILKFDLDLHLNVYLQYLLEQVHEFEKRHNGNIHSFIEWFNEKGYKESIQSPEGSNAVQIMTIHKSKGLQFPVVICAMFDWNFDRIRTEKWISNSSAALPAFPLSVNTNSRNSEHGDIIEEEYLKHELDMLNLVYVAFTRAENALFVSGSSGKQKSLIQHWVAPFLSEHYGMAKDEKEFAIGNFTQNNKPPKTAENTAKIAFCEQVMNKPHLSTRNGDQWDIHDLDKKREFGSQLHLLLSRLSGVNDISKELNYLDNKGFILAEFKHQIEEKAKELFEESHFAQYFEYEKVRNEKIIVDEEGKKHIPDKIIETDEGVIIVDFKTGVVAQNHETQVKKYISLLQELGYEQVKGELYYTETKEVKVVGSV